MKKLLNHSLQSEISRYTYDRQGNWTETEHNFDGTIPHVAKEIEYYD
ncbi:MAG: hypothetical protein LBG19_09210 [Prevotellaceae bacterium]|jgi:hypothetical protein|nr:hypothetical protein [Prevotellaceae bacterium]